MVLECLDFPLGNEGAVYARWYQLVLGACRLDERFHSC